MDLIFNNVIAHRALVAAFGFLMYFGIRWSMLANSKGLKTWRQFRGDQADEMRVTIIWSLGFLVLDDEIINGYFFVEALIKGDCSLKEMLTVPDCFKYVNLELPAFVYLFIPSVVDRLYNLPEMFKKK